MRTSKRAKIADVPAFKAALLSWAQKYEEVVWLDSNDHKQEYSKFDAVLAVDAFTALKTDASGAFDQLNEYQQITNDWIFGYLSYDLKNDTEALSSENYNGTKFPELSFFQPKKIFLLRGNVLEMLYLRLVDDELEEDYEEISKKGISYEDFEKDSIASGPINLQPRISKNGYLQKVDAMLRHIHRGDIYEANFCQEFYAEDAEINPFLTFKDLNAISNPPFAAFVRFYDHYVLSASPERYLQKDENQIISQPIKGTARRAANEAEDRVLAEKLAQDPKERSENVMIVDLVRNDLSKMAKKGSVLVAELCKVYTYSQVHQMISTVKAELAEGIPPVELLRSTFPMGSMTGAPKISAMKIIEELEVSRRGVYSGAIGYFTPAGDFDFNVVIRTILYNRAEKYVSFTVGGAITAQSIPENEYQECLLKAKALRQVLES